MKRILSIGKDDFYPQIFRLAVPIIIQNLLSAAVNSADVIMLNYVGQSAISAVSLAANYSNILFMVYYGIGTGGFSGDSCSRGNRTSFLCVDFPVGCPGCIYCASDDAEAIYQ